MPDHQRPFIKGRLYIHFNVDFPDSLSQEQCQILEKILSPRPSKHLTDMELDDCEETTMHDVNMEDEMRRKQQQHQYQEAYDEDDEQSMPRVQCAQQ
jgi:DnaJ family protein A protein 2